MQQNREGEQIKKEYQEIEIPQNGTGQVLEVIAKAKRQRNGRKRMIKYGTVVAAAFLLFLVPVATFTRGSGAEESNNMTMDAAMPKKETTVYYSCAGSVMEKAECGTASEKVKGEQLLLADVLGIQENGEEEINAEILRQIKERMESGGDVFFSGEQEVTEFGGISENQECYINEDGLLVIVFDAAELVPSCTGVVEFVIPEEIISIQKRGD